jgi:hypothetical protein
VSWDEERKERSTKDVGMLTENLLKHNHLVAVKAQWSLMCWRESLSCSGFDLAPLSRLKRRCIQPGKFAMYEVSKRVESCFRAEKWKV